MSDDLCQNDGCYRYRCALRDRNKELVAEIADLRAQLADAEANIKTYQRLDAYCEAHHDCSRAADEESCGKCDNCERAREKDRADALERAIRDAMKWAAGDGVSGETER